MLQLPIQNLRQRGSTLHFAEKAIPIVKTFGVDFKIGETELGVVFLEFWGGRCLLFDPFDIAKIMLHDRIVLRLETEDEFDDVFT